MTVQLSVHTWGSYASLVDAMAALNDASMRAVKAKHRISITITEGDDTCGAILGQANAQAMTQQQTTSSRDEKPTAASSSSGDAPKTSAPPDPQVSTASSVASDTAPPAASIPTAEEMREAANAAFARGVGKPTVRKLIEKHGGVSASSIPASNRLAYYTELQTLN